jgi:outer membrane protein assembly factor BamD (BamD/ComL family)
MAQKSTPKKTVAEDPRYTQALQSYEAGLRAMQEHKFEKAKPHFQKVITGPSKELTDRASVHLASAISIWSARPRRSSRVLKNISTSSFL